MERTDSDGTGEVRSKSSTLPHNDAIHHNATEEEEEEEGEEGEQPKETDGLNEGTDVEQSTTGPAEPEVKPWGFCQPAKEGEPNPYAPYLKVCRKVMTYTFSHVGLTALVIGYAVMGGFLFQFLEGKSEIVERSTVSKKRNATVTRIWLMTVDLNVLEQANWSVAVERIMKDFQDDVVVAIREKGWDGRDEFNHDISWSFPGALLYSVTVLTTIGYGNISPKTHWGRMATILYALLGIPLTLLCLTTIGSSWANCFRFLYKYTSLGMGRLSTCCCKQDQQPQKSLFREALNTKGVTVPLWVSLLIIGGYIGGGAVLFSAWQQDWDYLVAAYFCFITLSTIGFGDFVFGAGTEVNSHAKLITSSLYMFMGLAIIAMCFNLMQEEVKDRFIRIGLRLGIIKPKVKKKKQRQPQLLPQPQLKTV